MTWGLVTFLLGLAGVGGAVLWLVVGGGGLLAAWGVLRLIPSPRVVWSFLTHPVGVLTTMALLSGGFWIAGDLRGKRIGRAECEARIEQSRADAKAADARIAAEFRANADRQRSESAAREGAIKDEVQAYVEQLAKRTGDACRSGDDADRLNDGLDVRDDEGVPGTHPAAPARNGHRPKPGPVPKGSGK